MRVVDILLSLPLLFVILVASKFLGDSQGLLGTLFGPGSWLVVLIVFAIFGWPSIARLVRSLFLSLRSEVFVEAARAVGVGNYRIIFRHILPNAISPIIVATTLSVAGVIVGEAFVSFLGFGVIPADADLGQHPQRLAGFDHERQLVVAVLPGHGYRAHRARHQLHG